MADPEPEALQVYGFGSFTERRSGQPFFHILNDPKNGLPLLVAQPADTDLLDLAPEIPDLLAQAATGGVASVRNARLSSVPGSAAQTPHAPSAESCSTHRPRSTRHVVGLVARRKN